MFWEQAKKFQEVIVQTEQHKDNIFADYAGSDRKDGVISPDGRRYLIKYAETHMRKNDIDTSYVNNVLAEHLSSRIISK